MLCHGRRSRLCLQSRLILTLQIRSSPRDHLTRNTKPSVIQVPLIGNIHTILCYELTSATAMEVLSTSPFLDLLCECPKNKTFKSACTLTIAILIFLHVPFWLLRDLHWTDSVVLITKHFGPQSICFSSVTPETPFASPLPSFASKSNRGQGTSNGPVTAPTGNCYP